MDNSRIITLSLPTPYPVGDANAYLLTDGLHHGLVDAGVAGDREYAALMTGLAAQGLAPADLEAVAITHAHQDHSGGAVRLAREHGVPLIMQEASYHQLIDQPRARLTWGRAMILYGVPEDLLVVWSRFFGGVRSLAAADLAPLSLRFVAPGESFRLGGMDLAPLPTPGHCPDHLCFLVQDRDTAFTGDHLLPAITPNPLLYFNPLNGFRRTRSLVDYLRSLDALAGAGVSRGLPGHGGEIACVTDRIAKAREHISKRTAKLAALVTEDPEASPFVLSTRLFTVSHPAEQYLALSETVAGLDLADPDRMAVMDQALCDS